VLIVAVVATGVAIAAVVAAVLFVTLSPNQTSEFEKLLFDN
jgi:hypothetical protein